MFLGATHVMIAPTHENDMMNTATNVKRGDMMLLFGIISFTFVWLKTKILKVKEDLTVLANNSK